MNYFGTTTSTAATATGYAFTVTFTQPVRTDPNRQWVARTLRSVLPPRADAHEVQRVRTYLEILGFSPECPFDPHVARSTFRRMMRAVHPDAGGSQDEAKRITNAWNELKRRGLVR